jgi:hypothetical protein
MAKARQYAKKRYRMMFRFWLDGNKDEQLAIADYCEGLKHERSFTATLRDALRLIQDLRQQRLVVLFELFPWANAWLEERAEAIASSKTSSGDGDDSGGKIINLTAKIERLEQLLLERSTAGGMLMAAHEQQRRALPAPRPDLEDTQIAISRVKTDTTAVAQNFMRSLSAMSGTDFTPATKSSSGIKSLAIPQLAAPSFNDDDTLPLNLIAQ